jgi:hypothetical protein
VSDRDDTIHELQETVRENKVTILKLQKMTQDIITTLEIETRLAELDKVKRAEWLAARTALIKDIVDSCKLKRKLEKRAEEADEEERPGDGAEGFEGGNKHHAGLASPVSNDSCRHAVRVCL